MFSIGRLVVIMVAMMGLSACTSVPSVSARHAPFYNQANHTSQIVANAKSQSGLEYIQILVTTGRGVACSFSGDLPSPIPCRTDASTSSTACFFYNNEVTGSCVFQQSIVANTLVTYTVRVKDKSGRFAIQDPVTYSGGARIVNNYCWFKIPYLPFLECQDWAPLMPIWWQVQTPGGQNLALDQVDISLNEDIDGRLGDQQYSNMIEPIIANVFFNKTSSWSDDISYALENFTLWSGPDGANKDDCDSSDFNFSGLSRLPTAYTDAEVIFHSDAAQGRGCARIAFGGPSWEFVNRGGAAQRFIHEKGHSLAALGDEYFDSAAPNRGYSSSSIPNNVYSTEDACHSVANGLGISTTLCVKIRDPAPGGVATNYWRITDGTPELMADDQNTNADWRDASDSAFRRLLRRCAQGSCY